MKFEMNKIWRKPLHTRKVWKNMSFLNKSFYYLKPFVMNFMDIWLQPLPFPTIFKFGYSCVLIMLMLLPIIFPIAICISYYALIQILIESALDTVYPKNLDIVHYLGALFNFQIENDKYIEFLNLYMERWRYIATALSSCIDYIRLALSIIMN